MFVKCLVSRVMNRCSSSDRCNDTGARMALPFNIDWKLAVLIGICTALDIMLSNMSLFYITVTFYTIVKSGGNVWNSIVVAGCSHCLD